MLKNQNHRIKFGGSQKKQQKQYLMIYCIFKYNYEIIPTRI